LPLTLLNGSFIEIKFCSSPIFFNNDVDPVLGNVINKIFTILKF
jgi:hypothetical protein